MMMTKIVVFARRTHRLMALTMLVASLVMTSTGMAMKYPQQFAFINQGQARFVHNYISPVFVIILIVMAITGGFLYIYPWLLRIKPRQPQNT